MQAPQQAHEGQPQDEGEDYLPVEPPVGLRQEVACPEVDEVSRHEGQRLLLQPDRDPIGHEGAQGILRRPYWACRMMKAAVIPCEIS